MPRRRGHVLPFRIPFFRIFYSTTYTTIYIINLCLLAITPVSLIWSAIQNSAYQYTIMIGGTYVLTALTAIFIYASRLYTNRTVLAGVGKAYIPVEEGEVSKSVRKMIVQQLEKSAMVAWESRPRDLLGEILQAEKHGFLSLETDGMDSNDNTVGKEIPVDPAHPPWGDLQHAGWSSPDHRDDNEMQHLQFATVIAELPNLIEARAVALAPPNPVTTPTNGVPIADPVVADVLRRPETLGMRDYLTQLSYLGLVNPAEVGQSFLQQYERARFGGLPINETEFKTLMSAFAELVSSMTELDNAIIEQIREQAGDKASSSDTEDITPEILRDNVQQISVSPPHTPVSSLITPVTARTAPSRSITPYMQEQVPSTESLGSVIHRVPDDAGKSPELEDSRPITQDSDSLASLPSDAGSVLRRSASLVENG